MKKGAVLILFLSVIGMSTIGYTQESAKLEISKIVVSPKKPRAAQCCFSVKVWVKNKGNVGSGSYNMWVFVQQEPKPGTGQRRQTMTKDHGSGRPIVGGSIGPNREELVYSRSDWVVNYPQLHTVEVEIVGHDKEFKHFEAW